jgi:DNA-binding FadR family transcriptional regulator
LEPLRGKAQTALDQLGVQIVTGVRQPGTRLPNEVDLAETLGISRPSLREALRALATKGLIDTRTRSGTIVRDRQQWDMLDPDVLRWYENAPPDLAFLLDLLEVRGMFEPAAARLAAERGTSEQLLAIERAFRGMADSDPKRDRAESCERDLEFHERIIAAANNRILTRFASNIRSALLAAFRISSNARDSYAHSLQEHWAVADTILRREPDAAEQAMRQLLAGTRRDLAPGYKPEIVQAAPRRRAAGAGRR